MPARLAGTPGPVGGCTSSASSRDACSRRPPFSRAVRRGGFPGNAAGLAGDRSRAFFRCGAKCRIRPDVARPRPQRGSRRSRVAAGICKALWGEPRRAGYCCRAGALGESATSGGGGSRGSCGSPGTRLLSLDGLQSSRYETIVVTVAWEAEPSNVPSFVALPANDAISSVVSPSPRMETSLGMATPATTLAPPPTNSSNEVGVANSTTAVVAPLTVAIASPYATSAAAGSAPAAELTARTDPLDGETSPASISDSDSTEGGLLALDDMPAAAMQLGRQPGAAIGANFASNLNAQEAAGPALTGSTAGRAAGTQST